MSQYYLLTISLLVIYWSLILVTLEFIQFLYTHFQQLLIISDYIPLSYVVWDIYTLANSLSKILDLDIENAKNVEIPRSPTRSLKVSLALSKALEKARELRRDNYFRCQTLAFIR